MQIIRPLTIDSSNLTSSSVAEPAVGTYADPLAWSDIITYAQGDRVHLASTHRIYQSRVNSNTNHHPVTDPAAETYWLDIGPTNRYAMFDEVNETQTKATGTLVVRVTETDALVTDVVLLNVAAATARAVVTDPIEGVVYDETISLVSDSGILDWWAWLFEPIVRSDSVVFSNIPPYLGATIEITLSDPGEEVACGVCVFGQSREIGISEFGLALGVNDFSKKKADGFGNTKLLKRANSKKMNVPVFVEPAFFDECYRLLCAYLATPVVWIASVEFKATVVYGYFTDLDMVIPGATQSRCSLAIEGLI